MFVVSIIKVNPFWRQIEEKDLKNSYMEMKIKNKSCLKCRNKRKRFRVPKIQEPNDPITRYIIHQRLFKKLHNEFLEKACKKVHIYNMRHIFVDIRDCLIYSDKDFSYRNY